MVVSIALVSLTGCGGSSDSGEATPPPADSQYIGSWIATGAEFKDEKMEISEVLEEGDYILIFNEDGTGTSSYAGEDATGTWSETNDGLHLEGEDLHMDFTNEGEGKLSTELFGFKIFFEKQ